MTVPDWENTHSNWYRLTTRSLMRDFGLSDEDDARELLVALAYMGWEEMSDKDGYKVDSDDIEAINDKYLFGIDINMHWRRVGLELANKLISGHGIEGMYVSSDGGISNYGDDHVADYINTGDTYNATILITADDEVQLTTYGDFVEAWEQEEIDIDDFLQALSGSERADTAEWTELADGTFLTATYDSDCPGDSGDKAQDQYHNWAVNEGDSYYIRHWRNTRWQANNLTEPIDSLGCMVGYGGADEAMDAYAEQMGWGKTSGMWDPDKEKPRTPAPEAPTPETPTPVAPPGEEPLNEAERSLVSWMVIEGKWYDNMNDAVAHVMRMRKTPEWQKLRQMKGVHGLGAVVAIMRRARLMDLPSWRRHG